MNAARQASSSFTVSQSLLKLMSVESVIPSNHLILCHPLLLLPLIFPSIRIFSNELALGITWPKYWSFSFSISPSSEYSGLIPLGLTGLTSLLSKGLSRTFSSTTVWNHQFFGTQPSLWSNFHIHTWLLEKTIALTIWTSTKVLFFFFPQSSYMNNKMNENKRNYALNLWSYKKNTKINPGIAEKKSF